MPSALSSSIKMSYPGVIIFVRGIPQSDWPEIAERYQTESLTEIADSYGCVRNTVKRVLKEQGVVLRKQGQPTRIKRGPAHGSWKGGRFMQNGYVRIWADPLHRFYPMAVKVGQSQNAYFLEHRLVMAKSLGRMLESGESVHHINGNTEDNRLENLELRKGSHGPGQRWCCSDCGSINIIPVSLEG